MKAIFVVQGEGRGHLTQALALKKMFENEGHQVVEVMVGKSKTREIPQFFIDQIDTALYTFDSPNFLPSKDGRKFDALGSVAYNAILLPKYISSICLIRNHIANSGADIVVNFYEVLCGITCAMFHLGVPEVCIAHQYLFLHSQHQKQTKRSVSEFLLRQFSWLTCVGANAKLALSIRQYDTDRRHNIKVVPPLLRDKVSTLVRHHGDYLLGYILNPGFAADVVAWHKKHPDMRLHFFWDKPDVPSELKIDDTLTFHTINDDKFLNLMAGCRAYACTAGFESICEALYMGKPCMMIPAHVEQECNAIDAEQELVGIRSDSFDMERLMSFARGYEEDVEFRMWENVAETRIMSAIQIVYAEYHYGAVNSFTDANVSCQMG